MLIQHLYHDAPIISDKTYRDNHNSLNEQLVELGCKTDIRLDRIDEKIDDIKNLLIQKGE